MTADRATMVAVIGGCAALALGAGLVAVRLMSNRPEVEPQPTAVASAPPLPSSTATLSPTTEKPACDDSELYKKMLSEMNDDQEKAAKKTVESIRTWTPECRREAFEKRCKTRCFDFDVDRILEAAPETERKALLALRFERNEAALKGGDDIASKTAPIFAKANSLKGERRTLTEACAKRMGDDWRAIDAQVKAIEGALRPIGFMDGGVALRFAKSCLDCSDDRASCKDMNEQVAADKETLGEWRKMVEADRKALAR